MTIRGARVTNVVTTYGTVIDTFGRFREDGENRPLVRRLRYRASSCSNRRCRITFSRAILPVCLLLGAARPTPATTRQGRSPVPVTAPGALTAQVD